MATNHDVVENFVKKNRESSKGFSIVFRDNRLFSYDTCIAEWMKDGTLLVNRTKYSVTTSKYQNYLMYLLSSHTGKVVVVENVPRGAYNLARYAK